MSTLRTEEISAHHLMLAHEVLTAAAERDVPAEDVIRDRWPARGNGGVAHAQARTANLVRAAIPQAEAEWREYQRTAWDYAAESRYSEYAP